MYKTCKSVSVARLIVREIQYKSVTIMFSHSKKCFILNYLVFIIIKMIDAYEETKKKLNNNQCVYCKFNKLINSCISLKQMLSSAIIFSILIKLLSKFNGSSVIVYFSYLSTKWDASKTNRNFRFEKQENS